MHGVQLFLILFIGNSTFTIELLLNQIIVMTRQIFHFIRNFYGHLNRVVSHHAKIEILLVRCLDEQRDRFLVFLIARNLNSDNSI